MLIKLLHRRECRPWERWSLRCVFWSYVNESIMYLKIEILEEISWKDGVDF